MSVTNHARLQTYDYQSMIYIYRHMTIREDIEIPIGACHKITSDDLHNKTRTPCPASGPEGQTVVHVRWPSERAKKKMQ